MNKTIYVCDVCKQEMPRENLASFEVTNVKGLNVGPMDYWSRIHLDVCGECLRKKGFKISEPSPEELKANRQTLEDKLLDLLWEAAQELGLKTE